MYPLSNHAPEDAERKVRPLAEPYGPQEQVQLRTVGYSCAADGEPAGGGEPAAVEVPKIASSSRPCRPRVPMVQLMAEQLVEVPTIVSFSSLQQQTAEQIIDTPVPGRGGGGGWGGLQGQNSAVFLRADFPVPLGCEGGSSLQGLRPGQFNSV